MIQSWMRHKAGAGESDIAQFFKANADIDVDAYEYITEASVTAKLAGKGGKGGAKSGGGKRKADDDW
jgi:hypothetical protein